MKYICTVDDDNLEEIFTFPPTIDHDCMAEVVSRIKNSTPISAGFVSKGGTCHGHSITLGLKSRGDVDTELLNKQFEMY